MACVSSMGANRKRYADNSSVAFTNSMSGKQKRITYDMVSSLPKCYEFEDKNVCLPLKKRPLARFYPDKARREEHAQEKKFTELPVSNAACAEASDRDNAAYGIGKELVPYGEIREIPKAEKSGDEKKLVRVHEDLFPFIPRKPRSVLIDYDEYEPTPEKRSLLLIGNDDNTHEYEPPMDDMTDVSDGSDYEDEDEVEEKPRKNYYKARGGRKTSSSVPSPPQDMSEVMQQTVRQLGGETQVYWLFEKTLTMSDTKPQQGRIFITDPTLKDVILTPAEKRKYWVLKGDKSTNNDKEKKKYAVTLVEPDGRTSQIDFKIWGSLGKDKGKDPVEGEGQTVLTGSHSWNALVRKYKMQEGTKLQFWCFRKASTNELCFAINNSRA